MSRWLTLFAAALICAVSSVAAHAERRVALIIGNDDYAALPKLQKAAADASAYADLLQNEGFDSVMLKTNLTRSAMDEAIAVFLDAIQPGDTAVFAYSGHGWSDGTQNYIVGIDAPATGGQEFLARISIPLRNGATGVIDDMDRRGAATKVAIIDACRDNPFTPAVAGRSVGVGRGLVRIDPPRGTFVVFSASPGQTALDRLSDSDADPNSVFTRVFVPFVRQGLSLQDAVKETQRQVVQLARTIDHDQQPAYIDEMLGSTCLSGECRPVQAAAPAGGDAVEIAFWTSIAGSTSAADFEAYLRRYPEGAFAELAHNRLANLEAPPADEPVPTVQPEAPAAGNEAADESYWQQVLQAGDASAYEKYLQAFPDGLHADSARRRLGARPRDARAEPAPAASGDTYWTHNGSTVSLSAAGAQRIFRYVTPRAGVRDAGAKPGEVLFEGTKSGQAYQGTAYVFTRCGKIGYAVSGTVNEAQTEIVLTGDVPLLDPDCREFKRRQDTLVFSYLSRTRPEAAAAGDAPAGRVTSGEVQVRQTYQVDLDSGLVQPDGADLWFEAETRADLFLTPRNGARIALGRCGEGAFDGRRVSMDELSDGSQICVSTSGGRESDVTIERLTGESPKVLWLSYATR